MGGTVRTHLCLHLNKAVKVHYYIHVCTQYIHSRIVFFHVHFFCYHYFFLSFFLSFTNLFLFIFLYSNILTLPSSIFLSFFLSYTHEHCAFSIGHLNAIPPSFSHSQCKSQSCPGFTLPFFVLTFSCRSKFSFQNLFSPMH